MEAAIADGCQFQRSKNGYWEPTTDKDQDKAFDVLRSIVRELGYSNISSYLRASTKPERIREKMRQLLEEMEAKEQK